MKKLERAKGFEPSTPTLARSCSTPELHPHPKEPRRRVTAGRATYAKSRRRLQQSNDGALKPRISGLFAPPDRRIGTAAAAGGPTKPARAAHTRCGSQPPIRPQRAEPGSPLYGRAAVRQNAPVATAGQSGEVKAMMARSTNRRLQKRQF